MRLIWKRSITRPITKYKQNPGIRSMSGIEHTRGVYDGLLLTQYIHTCVVDRVQDGDTEVVDELCSIIQKLMR